MIAFALVVFVSVVSPSCTAGVQSALTSIPGDDGGDENNDEYKDNITGNTGMIACDLSLAPVPLKLCG